MWSIDDKKAFSSNSAVPRTSDIFSFNMSSGIALVLQVSFPFVRNVLQFQLWDFLW